MKKRVFSGIQPTGVVHLGNYLGALRNWVGLQDEYDCLYCIVDLHAITLPQKREELRPRILNIAAVLLSTGVDPNRSGLFVQSDVAEHSELAWILNCHTYMGELRRMTQFKDKKGEGEEGASLGLFDYPVLMAADILLHKAQAVPVGEDQKQHLELTRTLARRFNNLYGETFPVPEPIIPKQGARIMGLDDPSSKMSSSAKSDYNYVALDDPPESVLRKFKSAVTDSGREVVYDEGQKPALSNLLTIYSLVTGEPIPSLQKRYEGKGYAQFKKDLGEAVAEGLRPIQSELKRWESGRADLERILQDGARRAGESAARTLREVKEKVGLGLTGPAKLVETA